MRIIGKRDGEIGASAVEFAIILPFLLILVFGIIEFGFLLFDKAMVTNASREGARAGILYGVTDRGSEITNVVNYYLSNNLITFGTENLTIETLDENANSVDPDGLSSGDYLTVRVSYDYDFLVIPALIANLAGQTTLVANTTMRLE